MFKAKLIEKESYYNLRSKQLLLTLIPAVLMGLIANFYKIPIWLTIVVIGLYVVAIIFMYKNQKQLSSMLGKRQIEIDEQEIRIKSKKGIQKEIINLNTVDKLVIKDSYSIPQESLKEVAQEITGKTKQNYLIIKQNGQNRKLDFEIHSHYMIIQLNKITDNWKKRGYVVETINR